MDQIVRRMHLVERGGQRLRVEHIALQDLGVGSRPGSKKFGSPRETTKQLAPGLERPEKPSTDISSRAGNEDQGSCSRWSTVRNSASESMTSAPMEVSCWR